MKMEEILMQKELIKSIGQALAHHRSVFFLGRHYQLAIAHEGALKLKEISYLHAESYPAGELKHGPLALIDEDTPTVILLPNDLLISQNMLSVDEIRARKGMILTIGEKHSHADRHIPLPPSIDELYPFLTSVAVQLLAYYTAYALGREIDKPRNLAKSVTVR